MWGIEENPKAYEEFSILNRYKDIIWNKLNEKTHGSRGPEHVLRSALKMFDSYEDGSLEMGEFRKGCERFGLVLDHDQIKEIFQLHKTNASGKLDIEAFIQAICIHA